MPVQFTTDLPDVSAPSLSNGVEDEIGVSWSDVINHGDYRIQLEETDQSPAWDAGNTGYVDTTVGEATTSHTVTGREDGEEYRVRMRTETEHTDGSWTAAVSIVTKFPAATNVNIDDTRTTEVDVSWSDNADNEDGFRVERQENLPDDSWSAWIEVLDVGANVTSVTDTSALPGTEYRYRVVGYTEHTEGVSSVSASATTDSTPISQGPTTDGDDWRAAISHSGTDVPIHPEILEAAQWKPKLNDLPEVDIPVPRDDKWWDSQFDGAEISVWYDGDQLPIEVLDEPRQEPGQTVLTAFGGEELLNYYSQEVTQEDIHTLAENILTSETSYTINVDSPQGSTQENQDIAVWDTSAEFNNVLVGSIGDDEPVEITSDEIRLLQSGWAWEEDEWVSGAIQVLETEQNAGWSDEQFGHLDAPSDPEYRFNPDYDIPAGSGEIGIRVRPEDGGSTHQSFAVYFDNVQIREYTADSLSSAQAWRTIPVTEPADADTFHRIRIEGTGDSARPRVELDAVGFVDTRYGHNWAETLNNQEILEGPELYPDSVEIRLRSSPQALSVSGGRATISIDHTSGNQAIALSNDQGQTYNSSSNTAQFETDFSSKGTDIEVKLTLSRDDAVGDSTAIPSQGDQGNEVTEVDVDADLNTIPTIRDETLEGSILDILNLLASRGDYFFAIDHDGDSITVEWFSLGQRSGDSTPDIAEYESTKRSGPRHVYDEALVKGTAQGVEGEQFTANHGTWVDLLEDHLVIGRDTVYDESSGTHFERGSDYELDRSGGRIKTLSSGGMTDGNTYRISYWRETRGIWTKSGVSNPNRRTFKVDGLTSDAACEHAARLFVTLNDTPYVSLRATIPRGDPEFTVYEAINPPELPTDGDNIQLFNITHSPGQIIVEMGTDQSPSETIEEIRSRVGSISRTV